MPRINVRQLGLRRRIIDGIWRARIQRKEAIPPGQGSRVRRLKTSIFKIVGDGAGTKRR